MRHPLGAEGAETDVEKPSRKTAPKNVPSLEERIRAELGDNAGLCPLCGSDWIIEGTRGYEYGVCPECYLKAKTRATRAHARMGRLETDYDAARQEKSRAERSGLVPKVNGKSLEPDFSFMYD